MSSAGLFCFSQPRAPCPSGRGTVRRGAFQRAAGAIWRGDRGLRPGPGSGRCACRRSTMRMASGGFRSLPVCPRSGSGQAHRLSPVALEGTSHGVEAPSCPELQFPWPATMPTTWSAAGTLRARPSPMRVPASLARTRIFQGPPSWPRLTC